LYTTTKLNLALVRAAVLQQCLKLAAVRGLGALAFLVEALEDFVALTAAILLARAELRRQTEVLGLLLRAHADVDHRADHRSQLSAIVGVRQGDRCAAHFLLLLPGALLQEYLYDDTRHRVSMLTKAIDVVIRQTVSFFGQQLPTTRDRDLVGCLVLGVLVIHGSPHTVASALLSEDLRAQRADHRGRRAVSLAQVRACCRHQSAGPISPCVGGQGVARDHLNWSGRHRDACRRSATHRAISTRESLRLRAAVHASVLVGLSGLAVEHQQHVVL
jgi:hypothetical protein